MTLERDNLVFAADSDIPAADGVFARLKARMDETKADIVVGTVHRASLLNRLYYFLVRTFLGVPLTETQAGVHLFRKDVYDYARQRALAKGGARELELLVVAAGHGARIVEADVGFDVKASPRYLIRHDTLAVFYRARILGYYERCLVPRPLDHRPLVSVVIACPNRSAVLDECLKGLATQTYANWEAIVLPDGETELETPRDNVRVLPTGKVRPAEKRNLGIREAKGEIVAFIDDDAYPAPDWLELAVRYFGEDSIGAVGGPGVTPPGDAWLAKIGGEVYDNVLVSGNYRYRYKAGGVRKDVEDYPSCNLLVRKDLLEKIGGYRTDFWPGEDTLLCKDIIDNWKRIVYDPWVVVYHHRRALFLPHLRQLGRYGFHRGYFCKRFPSNSLRASYFVPTAFVCGLPFIYWLWPLYALYAVLVLVTSFRLKPHVWLFAALGVVASHICYGIRFAQGLLAKRAPCEFIGKDHL